MALLKLLYPGMRIKRWFFLFAGGVVAAGFGVALLLNYRFIGLVRDGCFGLSTGRPAIITVGCRPWSAPWYHAPG